MPKLPTLNLTPKVIIFTLIIFIIPFLSITIFWSMILNLKTYPESHLQQLILQILALFLINFGLVLALFIWILKSLIQPIKIIRLGVEHISSGHYDYRIPTITNDDIGKTATAINTMAATLYDLIVKSEHNKNVILTERNKLALAISSISEGIITLDNNLNITLFNKAAEYLTGYSQAEVLGKRLGTLVHFSQGQIEIPESEYCSKDPGGFTSSSYEKKALKLVGRSGKESTINLLSKQIKQSGSDLGYIISIQDVSKESQLEAMKLDFVSMAAHELRTPLTSIKGYLAVYRQENEAKFTSEQKMFLDRISIATQQLSALVENILSVAKIERGAFSLSTQAVNWQDIVKQTVGDFTLRAKSKRISLTFTDPIFEIPKLNLDKIRATEVLSNILANSINYTDVGGSVNVWMELKDNFVITHVKDTGIGLTPDQVQHLFSKFYRVLGKLEGTMKGNGLGLYITKSIVELHKGKIWVESAGLGKGSTFSFSFPLPQPEPVVKYNF